MTEFLVTRVIDGDTFEVSPQWQAQNGSIGNRVRIANFNAPEANTSEGQQATQNLKIKIAGKRVHLDEQAVDVYGRLVAKIQLA